MAWNIFQKAAPEREASDAPKQVEVLYLQNGTSVGLLKWNEYIAMEAALSHPIVFRALDKLAQSVQQVRLFAELDPFAAEADRAGKARFIQDLQAVLDNPNDDLTAVHLRYWLGLNMAGYGRAPLKFTYSSIRKRLNGIYPLEARHTAVKVNQRAQVTQFEYGSGENKEVYPSKLTRQPDGDFVGQVWKIGLRGYQSNKDKNTPLESIGLPAQVIKALLIRAIQTAQGHPNVRYLVTCSKTLTDAQKKALKEYLNEDHGPEGPDAGRIPILQNAADVEIHKLDNDLSDIHSKMPSDDMARLIFGAFGIPIALAGMGAADAAKFAGNYAESRLSFWEDTVVPFLITPICSGLTQLLCPAGVRISPDLDSVPAMMHGRIQSMKAADSLTFLTTNEKREMFGWEPTTAIPQTNRPTNTGGQGETNE